MTTKKLILYFLLAILAAVGLYVLVKVLAALSFVFILGFALGAVSAFAYVYKFNKNKRTG